MKKLFVFMAALAFAGTTVYAQSKEELKAQKEAQKEAMKAVKKAQSTYTLSIPSEQYGRKETDFAKLAPAKEMIDAAIVNQYSMADKETWKVAADIYNEYYKKLENDAKADESVKPQFIETAAKLIECCVKFDELVQADPKAKPNEKELYHTQYQNMAINPAIQLLQAAQNYSNESEEDQESMKLGAKYSELFLNTMEKSALMKDFSNENLADWLTYAKAFRAQSFFNIKGTPEAKILEVYEPLMSTRYKSIAIQTLSNYYSKAGNAAKQNEYLKRGIDVLKGDEEQKDLRANFALMLMQNLFQAKDKAGFKEIAQLIKTEMGDNDNAINAYLMEGQMLFEEQKYEEAENVFNEAAKAFPDESRGPLMAARCAWMKAQANGGKKAEMDHAITLFKNLETKYPKEPDMWGESLYILYNNTNQPALAAKYKKYYKAM